MRTTINKAIALVFGDEGAYSNRATDKGGPTKYGITHTTLAQWRKVPFVTPKQVQALTLEEASEIYRAGYWNQSGGDLLPTGLDYAVFDAAVLSGSRRAVMILQKLLKDKGLYTLAIDGVFGLGTKSAVDKWVLGIDALIQAYCDERMKFLRSIKNPKTGFPVNGRGWTIRVTGVDPIGKFPSDPGVVGNAKALAHQKETTPIASKIAEISPAVAAALPVDAKAIPDALNAWLKPEVFLTALPIVLGAIAPFMTGPILYALGAVIVIAAATAGYYAFRRINKAFV